MATRAEGARRLAWTEVRVDVPRGWHEVVAETLIFGPCTSVTLGTTSLAARQPGPDQEAVRSFVLEGDDTPALRAEVEQRLLALEERVGDPELAGLEVHFKRLPPEDYATSWRKDWKPFRVGRLALLPPWYESDPPRATDVRLTIEPVGSFGSGRHATTRTCLRALSRRIQGGERLLDAGAGSGILSVGAALLGARETYGFDLDPASKPTADLLAQDNGVEDRCAFREGDFRRLEEVDGLFDVVCANIYADVLMTHAHDLAQRLAPTGWFCFSGCRFDHVDATRRSILEAGLRIDEEHLLGRWMTFVGHPA